MAVMRRKSERVNAAVPVNLKDQAVAAVTADLSPTGVFILTEAALEIGQTLRFTIEFENNVDRGGALFLECVGQVVRVQADGGRTGVGVQMSETRLERREFRRVHPEAPAATPRSGRRRPWDAPKTERQISDS